MITKNFTLITLKLLAEYGAYHLPWVEVAMCETPEELEALAAIGGTML